MSWATVRLYGELNDFLPPPRLAGLHHRAEFCAASAWRDASTDAP
jgi:hypothetical protein